MKVIADRIEGDYIVAELPGGSTVNMPRALAPEAKEGDVINIIVDDIETEKRRVNADEKLKNIFKHH